MLEQMIKAVAKKLIAQEYPHVKLPAVVYDTLTVVDRFGNVDETFPAHPGGRTKAQYKAGAVVAVALAYGDSPAIIGEVQL